MTFYDAAALGPDVHAGELDRGNWVPLTRTSWTRGVVAGNIYAVLRAYAKASGGWSVSINDPGTKLASPSRMLRRQICVERGRLCGRCGGLQTVAAIEDRALRRSSASKLSRYFAGRGAPRTQPSPHGSSGSSAVPPLLERCTMMPSRRTSS